MKNTKIICRTLIRMLIFSLLLATNTLFTSTSIAKASTSMQQAPLWPELTVAAANTINITSNGFDPATLNVFGPTDITWINTTNVTHTLQSGEPQGETGGSSKIFLPLVQRGSPSAVEAASAYLSYLYQQAEVATFSATLAPGQSFTYRFTTPSAYKFYLSTAPTIKGSLTLSGVGLLRSSPNNGEGDVAVTRETILEFSGPLDPASVTSSAFIATAGSKSLDYRLVLSADKTRVSLFYKDSLPGSTRVRVSVDGGKLKDAQGNNVDVDGDGTAGGNNLLEFDTLSLTVIPGTSVCGRVFASELAVTASNVSVNTPLQGVTVSVDGLEESLNTKTDANGNFCLNPAPAGRFFVHVDGRSATNNIPAGQYYPFVGKAWQSTPGQQTSVGEIYLPLIPANTLQPVSTLQDTQITFPDSVLQTHPDLKGVSILVPADSLFSDDGSRGGKVGIAPVPPDRLPGGLPKGLDFPVVITVQTDGAMNFDKPAPVCFPNLPDPNTHQKLQPGAKDALYSFNHDIGGWEAVGAMTVTQDGKLVCSDPGVGIRAPGWHGSGPPPVISPPPPLIPCPIKMASVNTDPCNSKPPCDIEGFAACFTAAGEKNVNSQLTCSGNAAIGATNCAALVYVPEIGPGLALACLATTAFISHQCVGAAKMQYNQDVEQCEKQYNCGISQNLEVNSTLGYESNDIDPVFEQVNQTFQQIYNLIEPYVQSKTEIPANIRTQIDDLIMQMNNITGGDVEEYVRRHAIQAEMSLSLEGIEGNAPTYAIPYLATIQRSNGVFYLRGKTGPLGQYTIFVPRDGLLISMSFYDPLTQSYGLVLPYIRSNVQYLLPRFTLNPIREGLKDFDSDNLPDIIETIYGTDLAKADTDSDGINDGIEVQNGTDPLGGFIAQTGIIATADTPGTAVDVCAVNESTIAVADSADGVAIFNIFNGMDPKIIAQVDTPGSATAVACTQNRVAVADANQGLALIDVTNPSTAKIIHQVNLGANSAQEVAIVGDRIYVASGSEVVLVDVVSGTILDRQQYSGGTLHDLSISRDYIYLLYVQGFSPQTVHKIRLGDKLEPSLASLTISGHPTFGRTHIFAGGDLIYVGAIDDNTSNQTPGIGIIRDLGSELSMVGPPSAITAFDVEVNSSGLALFTGADPSLTANARFALLDVKDPTKTDRFITAFDTPGSATAIALENGLAYVADQQAGLQVINYLAYDSKGISPTVDLMTNFAPGVAEEATSLRVTAVTSDDVQVRNVEFYVDGQRVGVDGNFPFEIRFTTPKHSVQPSFKLRARAIDTGGNIGWSEEQIITLVTDATPPYVTSVSPASGFQASVNEINKVSATFSEPINPATITNNTFRVFSAGVNGVLGDVDDTLVTGGVASYDNASLAATITFPSPLQAGHYRAVLSASMSDPTGNVLGSEYSWTFLVIPVVQLGDTITASIGITGELDIYRFSATAGQQIYFDVFNVAIGLSYVSWQVSAPNGQVIFTQWLGVIGGIDPGVYTLPQSGVYTITVGIGPNTGTGAYSFKLWNVTPPHQFGINIGDTITNGIPGVGAGNIETPGVKDIYTFSAVAGQQVFFDVSNVTNALGYVNWRVNAPNGQIVFNQVLGLLGGIDPGVYSLTQGGTYTITVGSDRDANTGTYSFRLWNVPSPTKFNISIGDTVSNGIPGSGAGNIETPGSKDTYTFNATVGQKVYFDVLNIANALTNVHWRVNAPDGQLIFDSIFNFGGADPGAYTLPKSGVYTITVGDDRVAGTGTYSFQIRLQ